MSFGEQIALLLVDKVLIAGIAAAIWWVYSTRRRELDRVQQHADIAEKEARDLKMESALRMIDERIFQTEQKLEKLLWPLVLCMRKDDAIWQRVPGLYDDSSQLPTEAGILVERNFLLPNHSRGVELIEQNFHFVATDDALMEPMIQYIRHVAVFKSLRVSRSDLNPIDVGEPFPSNLSELLEKNLDKTKRELAELRERRAEYALPAT